MPPLRPSLLLEVTLHPNRGVDPPYVDGEAPLLEASVDIAVLSLPELLVPEPGLEREPPYPNPESLVKAELPGMLRAAGLDAHHDPFPAAAAAAAASGPGPRKGSGNLGPRCPSEKGRN